MNPFEICDITMPPHRLVIGPKTLFPDFVETEPERTTPELRSFLLSVDMYLGGAQQLRECTNRWPGMSMCLTPSTPHREVVDLVMQAISEGVLIATIADSADMAAVTDADIRAAGADKRLPPSVNKGGNVAGMSYADKLQRCLEFVPDQIGEKLGAQAKAEIEGLFSPTNIAITAGILVVWAGSHAFGVGFVVDGVLLGVGLLFAGWEAIKAFEKIGEFFKAVGAANSDRELMLAAGLLAAAIAILGVAGFKALLRRVTPKTPKGGGQTEGSTQAAGRSGAGGSSGQGSTSGGGQRQRGSSQRRQNRADDDAPPPAAPVVPKTRQQNVRLTEHHSGRTVTRDVDLQPTLDRIKRGESFPHRNDGSTFQNRPKRSTGTRSLPEKPQGYYKEYVVPTPEFRPPGPQRIVKGQNGEIYYTPDHYENFTRIDQ